MIFLAELAFKSDRLLVILKMRYISTEQKLKLFSVYARWDFAWISDEIDGQSVV